MTTRKLPLVIDEGAGLEECELIIAGSRVLDAQGRRVHVPHRLREVETLGYLMAMLEGRLR